MNLNKPKKPYRETLRRFLWEVLGLEFKWITRSENALSLKMMILSHIKRRSGQNAFGNLVVKFMTGMIRMAIFSLQKMTKSCIIFSGFYYSYLLSRDNWAAASGNDRGLLILKIRDFCVHATAPLKNKPIKYKLEYARVAGYSCLKPKYSTQAYA